MFYNYLFIQSIAYCIDLGIFFMIFQFSNKNEIIANLLSKIISAIFSFYFLRKFVFLNFKNSLILKQVNRFFLILILNLPISSLTIFLISKFISLAILAKFISDVLCVLLSFWLTKNYTFAKK